MGKPLHPWETYADYGNVFDIVFEAGWLLVSVRHLDVCKFGISVSLESVY